DHPGQLVATPGAYRPALEQYLPVLNLHQTEQRAEQRGLASPVGPDDRHQAPWRYPHRDTVQGEVSRAGVAHAGVDRRETHRTDRRSRTAKSGTPTSAVTTPTGSSIGRTTVRAAASANTRKPPPARN